MFTGARRSAKDAGPGGAAPSLQEFFDAGPGGADPISIKQKPLLCPLKSVTTFTLAKSSPASLNIFLTFSPVL